MSSLPTKLLTADDLLAMGDIGRCELIYGEVVMMSPAGAEHGVVALHIGRFLAQFVEESDLGLVFAAETGFRIAENPDTVRAPDVSFVSKERLPRVLPKGFFEGPPDLAVEVVSPGESIRDVNEKVNMWLAGGVKSVWVAQPATMSVSVHRTGEKAVVFQAGGSLSDPAILPGFELNLSRVFKKP